MSSCTPLQLVVLLTAFYTFLLVIPSIINPFSNTAKYLQYISILFTVLLPLLWCMYTVTNIEPINIHNLTPYWGTETWHGANGNHDFCEPNYVYYKHIVEFHNTWSSVLIISYGTIGTYYTRKYATLEGRFPCSFIAIGGVGVGSTLFHGALRSWGQILDEVPMLFIIFAFAYCHLETNATPKYYPYLPIALITSCFVFIGAYLFFYFYAFFLMGFSGGVVLILSYGVSIFSKTSRLSKAIFLSGLCAFLIGFSCWIVDDMFCEYVQTFNMHIGWHVFTGLGAYLFVMFQVTLRAKPLKKEAILIIPYVVYNAKTNAYHLIGMEIKANKNVLIWNETECLPEFFLPYVALR
eukprot:390136_1